MTRYRTPGEIRTRDLAIKSPVLYQLSNILEATLIIIMIK